MVILALNQLEEDRTEEVLRKDLKQVTFVVAVDEHVALGDGFAVFAHTLHAFEHARVVLALDVEKLHWRALELLERAKDIERLQRDVLHARAFVIAQVLVDLRALLGRFVDRNAKVPAR